MGSVLLPKPLFGIFLKNGVNKWQGKNVLFRRSSSPKDNGACNSTSLTAKFKGAPWKESYS